MSLFLLRHIKKLIFANIFVNIILNVVIKFYELDDKVYRTINLVYLKGIR